MTDGLFYEDFAIGDTFVSAPEVMTLARIISFAQEFDPQIQHVDAEAARATAFGELVASGWHTAAFTMRLLVRDGAPKIAGGNIGAGIEGLGWPIPVRPGDALHTRSEIVGMRVTRSRPDRGIVQLRTLTINQNGETVQTLTASLFVPLRAAQTATPLLP